MLCGSKLVLRVLTIINNHYLETHFSFISANGHLHLWWHLRSSPHSWWQPNDASTFSLSHGMFGRGQFWWHMWSWKHFLWHTMISVISSQCLRNSLQSPWHLSQQPASHPHFMEQVMVFLVVGVGGNAGAAGATGAIGSIVGCTPWWWKSPSWWWWKSSSWWWWKSPPWWWWKSPSWWWWKSPSWWWWKSPPWWWWKSPSWWWWKSPSWWWWKSPSWWWWKLPSWWWWKSPSW